MQKIVIGVFALLILAVVVGLMANWYMGIGIAIAPILVTYVRLKLSPGYRTTTGTTLIKTLNKS